MHQFTAQLLNGIQLGSVYALIALGYTMVYGVLKLINFAHGDVYMVGAYAGLGAATVLGARLPALLPTGVGGVLILLAAMLLCALLGLVIEQAAYRPLRSRAWVMPALILGGAAAYIAYHIATDANRTPASSVAIGLAAGVGLGALLWRTQRRRVPGVSSRLTALITAIGISLFLENFGNLPQIFTPDPQFYPPTLWHPAHAPKGMVIFALALILMGLLTFIVTRTRIGKAIRAVSYDADAAALMGINTDHVIAFTFALGAALAGAAGVMVSWQAGTSFNPYAGILPGLKAFVAAVLGGIGNIPGAALGGLIMGVAETMVVAYGPYAHIPEGYQDAVAFFLLILILLVRPSGLLGRVAPEKV
ncbi:MAG: branched-chain amino acid ABC transporter permease [Armatimonadetes bacterium]|nr:branched-chain amino acid ABC transporter permease [Armatimonadota bacterium]